MRPGPPYASTGPGDRRQASAATAAWGEGKARSLERARDDARDAPGRGSVGLLAVGLVVVIVAALAFLLGSVVADDLSVLAPGRLLATWAAR